MTQRRTRHQQVLPNRRFARLLPAAMASIALAGASVAGPAAARADAQRAAHAGAPPKVASATPAAAVARGATRQPHATT